MKTNRIMTLVIAAAVLAVVTSGMASAMTPSASLNNGPTAVWNNDPNNSHTTVRSGTFSETCSWVYSSPISGNVDGVYVYSSVYTAPQYNQVLYRDLLTQPGQSKEKATTVTAGTYTGSNKPYNICLGFYIGLNSYFTSTDQETITVNP